MFASWQPVKINSPQHPAHDTAGYVVSGDPIKARFELPAPTDENPAATAPQEVDTWPVRLDLTGKTEHFPAALLVAL